MPSSENYLHFPAFYIQLYAIKHGLDTNLAFYSVSHFRFAVLPIEIYLSLATGCHNQRCQYFREIDRDLSCRFCRAHQRHYAFRGWLGVVDLADVRNVLPLYVLCSTLILIRDPSDIILHPWSLSAFFMASSLVAVS